MTPSSAGPLASVIIPNWNGCHHLETCLEALHTQSYEDFEVIVVDNGSTDGSQAFLQDSYPYVTLVALGENRGFTGACNAGYAVSRGEFVVLLNNDTEADAGWLKAIVETFQAHPTVGIIASKLLLFDDRKRFHAAGDLYSLDGVPSNRGFGQEDTGQYDRIEPVFGACGAAAAYRREMLDEIGFLDDVFFFSCEDVDLAWRAHLAGWQVLYVPEAVVYHKLKASGGNGTTSSYYDGRNFLYIIWKNYPSGLLRKHWPEILGAQWQISLDAMRSWRGEAARARLRGQLAGVIGLPTMLSKRRAIQRRRIIDDRTLSERLTQVDHGYDRG